MEDVVAGLCALCCALRLRWCARGPLDTSRQCLVGLALARRGLLTPVSLGRAQTPSQDLKDKFRECGNVVYANVTRGDDGAFEDGLHPPAVGGCGGAACVCVWQTPRV